MPGESGFLVWLVALLAILAIAWSLRLSPSPAALRKRFSSAVARAGGLDALLLRHILTAAACFALALLAVVLVEEVFFRQSDPARIGSLVVLLLLVALCLQAGPRLIQRLKKLGPLELFEQSSGLIDSLVDYSAKVDHYLRSQGNDLGFQGKGLSPSELFAYQQVDVCLTLIEHSGEEPTAFQEGRYFEVLKVVGSIALLQREGPRAIARFECLRKASKDSYKTLEVAHLLGGAYLLASLDEQGENKAEFLARAANCFRCAVKEDPGDYSAFVGLGVVEHLLGNYGSAIDSNQRALQIRSQLAAAKYNLAASYSKANERDKALTALTRISRDDESFSRVTEAAHTDRDFEELRRDPRFARILASWQN
jgi:tetratricopeptide (TPR) repeat protein